MNKIEFYSNLANFQGRNGDAFLKHYGIIGQKWGVRKWQNYDGTFNEAGKERYFGSKNKEDKINDKAEKMTQHMISHPVLYNSKGIPEEDIRKYFKAFYSIPMLLRSTYNVNNKYREMYGEDPNRKLDFNMRTMEQNSYAQNARTAIPLGSMEGSKVKSKYQNPDGTLTQAGKEYYAKYRDNEKKLSKKINLEIRKKLKSEIEEENKITDTENKKIFNESAEEFGYNKVKNNKQPSLVEAYGDKASYEKVHNTKEGKIKELLYDMTDFFKDHTEYGTDMPGRTTKLSKEDSKKYFKEVQDMFKDFDNINYMIKDQISTDYDVNMNNIKLVPSVGIQTTIFNNKAVQNDNSCTAVYNIKTDNGWEHAYVEFRPDGLVKDVDFVD